MLLMYTQRCIVIQEASIKPMDKLRLALVYLLTTINLPSDSDFDWIEKALEGVSADSLSALRHAAAPSLTVSQAVLMT